SIAAINAAVSLVDGAALINKAAFPRLTLPISAVLSNAVNYLMTVPLLVTFNLLFGITPTLSFLLLPCAFLLLLLMAIGMGVRLAIAVGGALGLLGLGLWIFQRLAVRVSEL